MLPGFGANSPDQTSSVTISSPAVSASPRQSARTTTTRTRPATLHLTRPPLRNVGTQPELHATLAEVEYRSWHVVVAALVLEHGVAMREAEQVGDALSIQKILCMDLWSHEVDPTFVGGGPSAD